MLEDELEIVTDKDYPLSPRPSARQGYLANLLMLADAERRRGFVQENNRSITQNSVCDRDRLALDRPTAHRLGFGRTAS